MIKILTDSVASIPADAAREAGIDIITLYVNLSLIHISTSTRWTSQARRGCTSC